MPRCPSCHRHFAVLPDEEGMHDCPYCGTGPERRCEYCRRYHADAEEEYYCQVDHECDPPADGADEEDD